MAFVSEFDGLDLELYFCTEIMKLRSLHYGYFESTDPVNLDILRKAQTKYTETLIDMIPEGVDRVLDVGCGIGDVSNSLYKRGYKVVAISPDKNHGKYFVNVDGELEFMTSCIEKFQPDRKFDMVLMSESQNYFDSRKGFRKCRQCLNPKGYVLVSGMFRKHEHEEISELGHTVDSYVNTANEMGYDLVKYIDITRETRPTIEYAHVCTKEYVERSMKMAEHFLMATSFWRKMFIKTVFSPHIKRLRKLYKHYQERVDPVFYDGHIEYARLLMRQR